VRRGTLTSCSATLVGLGESTVSSAGRSDGSIPIEVIFFISELLARIRKRPSLALNQDWMAAIQGGPVDLLPENSI
jgi:hypothetical protein